MSPMDRLYADTDFITYIHSDVQKQNYHSVLIYANMHKSELSEITEEELNTNLKKRTDIKIVIKANDLFKPISNYSNEEILNRLSRLGIDALLIIEQNSEGVNSYGRITNDYTSKLYSIKDKRIAWGAYASSIGSIFTTQKSLATRIANKTIDNLIKDKVLEKHSFDDQPERYQEKIAEIMLQNPLLQQEDLRIAQKLQAEKEKASQLQRNAEEERKVNELAKVREEGKAQARIQARQSVKDRAIQAKLKVGDKYGAGIVFLIRQPGELGYVSGERHGLIAAKADEYGEKPWSAFDMPNDGWYIPRKNELNHLYLNKDIVGGFSKSMYWTSSEASTNTGYMQLFVNGVQLDAQKACLLFVRRIRAF